MLREPKIRRIDERANRKVGQKQVRKPKGEMVKLSRPEGKHAIDEPLLSGSRLQAMKYMLQNADKPGKWEARVISIGNTPHNFSVFLRRLCGRIKLWGNSTNSTGSGCTPSQ